MKHHIKNKNHYIVMLAIYFKEEYIILFYVEYVLTFCHGKSLMTIISSQKSTVIYLLSPEIILKCSTLS